MLHTNRSGPDISKSDPADRSKQTIYLLRHAKTQIDETKSPEYWHLDDTGMQQSKDLASDLRLHHITHIFSSTETKAIQTVEPLSHVLGIEITQLPDLCEAQLDKFYNLDKFVDIKKKKFLDPDLAIGEAHRAALLRFDDAMAQIRREVPMGQILVCTHGTVMTLYLGQVRRMTPEQMFEFWNDIEFVQLETI